MTLDNTDTPPETNEQQDSYKEESAHSSTASPSKNMFETFVHGQPVLSLSLAFGLGLLATSLLANTKR